MLFFKDTIDSVMDDFTKKVEKLYSLVEDHNEKVLYYGAIAEEATKNSALHRKEAQRARNIANKISSFLE